MRYLLDLKTNELGPLSINLGCLQSWSGISGTSDESVETFVHPVAVRLVPKVHQYVGDVVERAFQSLQELASSPFDA